MTHFFFRINYATCKQLCALLPLPLLAGRVSKALRACAFHYRETGGKLKRRKILKKIPQIHIFSTKFEKRAMDRERRAREPKAQPTSYFYGTHRRARARTHTDSRFRRRRRQVCVSLVSMWLASFIRFPPRTGKVCTDREDGGRLPNEQKKSWPRFFPLASRMFSLL